MASVTKFNGIIIGYRFRVDYFLWYCKMSPFSFSKFVINSWLIDPASPSPFNNQPAQEDNHTFVAQHKEEASLSLDITNLYY